mgnify:FL=1
MAGAAEGELVYLVHGFHLLGCCTGVQSTRLADLMVTGERGCDGCRRWGQGC